MMKFFGLTTSEIFASLLGYGRKYNFLDSNLVTASAQFNDYRSNKAKLEAVLSNPALLKVFGLQCDLFSLGKIYVYDKNGNDISEKDPLKKKLEKPNPFTGENQFLWNWMFWHMMGNSYIHPTDKNPESRLCYLYNLESHKIDWPTPLQNISDKLIYSPDTLNELMKMMVTYRYTNGSVHKIPLSQIITSTDLTNGIGNFWQGASRIDALYKVISNSEASLDSQNINLRYSGKFMVSSKKIDIGNTGLSVTEKEDIKSKISKESKQEVFPMQSSIDLRRFVDDYTKLGLSDAYLHTYFVIGSMYGWPKDVLEAFSSGTYENQQTARAVVADYVLKPKGEELMSQLSKYFGYDEQGKKMYMDWSHLSFTHILEKQKSETERNKIESFEKLVNMGVRPEAAAQFLDLPFVDGDIKPKAASNPI